MKDLAIKLISKRSLRVISLSVVSLALMLPISPSALAQDLQLRVDPIGNILDMTGKSVGKLIEFTGEMPQLTVDAAGNILDASNRVVGKVAAASVDTTVAVTSPESVKLRMDTTGNLFDSNGVLVGKIDPADSTIKLRVNSAGAILSGETVVGQMKLVTAPAENIDTLLSSPPLSRTTTTVTTATVPVGTLKEMTVVSEGSATTAVTTQAAPTQMVVRKVTIIDEVNFRRNEVATNISDRLAAGRITADQAAALKALLDSILPVEQTMRTDGLTFKESKKLFTAFDKVANELDHVSAKPGRKVAAMQVIRLD